MRGTTVFSLMAVLGAGFPLTAMTQNAPAEAESADGGLSEIVVTARRVEERAQDVPISMTLFSQQALSDRNIITADDLAAFTPSMTVDNTFGQDNTTFAIRGFTQTESTTTPSVAVYFADAVTPRGGSVGEPAGSGVAQGSFFDLQNLQVLKGPQGTLFGRNTDGGAVLLVPKKPTSEFGGYIEGAYGNYAMGNIQAVVNFPIGDRVRVRLGVNHETRTGYLENVSGIGPRDFGNVDFTAARASVVVDMLDNLENYTVASYNLSVTHGGISRVDICNSAVPGGGTIFCPATTSFLQGASPYSVTNSFPNPESFLKEYQVVNTTTWQALDTLTVKNIANYGLLQTDFNEGLFGSFVLPGPTFFPSADSDAAAAGGRTTDQYTFTDEIRVSGSLLDSRLTWQAGGYIERSGPQGELTGTRSAVFLTCTNKADLTCAGFGVLDQNSSTIHFGDEAAYAQGTYTIFSQLKATAGIRYTNDVTTAVVHLINHVGYNPAVQGPPALTVCGGALPGMALATNCTANFTQQSNAPTYTFNLDYTPITDLLIYAKYSRGYRQGGVATFVSDNYHLYGPEHVNSWELGEKYTFSGPVSGTFDVTGHYNRFSDQQLLAGFNPINPATAPSSSGIVNAGTSRIWGIESEATLVPVKPVTLALSYAYLNTKLTSAFESPPAGGLYFPPTYPSVVGGELPYSPKNKVAGSATYRMPAPESLGSVSLSANYTYTSGELISVTNAPFASISGYGLLGMNLHWDHIARSFISGELFATNLTNRYYTTNYAALWNTAFGITPRFLGEPRMYGLRVHLDFGRT